MIKSLLIGGSLALTAFSSAMAADITFSVTNEQTSGSTYTADMLVQHASGTTELIPFIATATGQYNMRISTPGSLYTPAGQASFRFWGPGAGSGNAYQPPGGGSPPPEQVIYGGSELPWMEGREGEQIQAIPIGYWIFAGASSCYAGRLMAATLAQTHCLATGLRSVSYGLCGGGMSVDCFDPPPPPQPVQPNPPSNGSGGGGCAGCGSGGGSTLIFIPFNSSVPQGTVTVGDIVNEE